MICGLDEAGRGPLAGPVVAGAVILCDDFPIDILDDSKRLSHKRRAAAEQVIRKYALCGVGVVDEKTIDEVNILRASLMAMEMAFRDMMTNIDGWAAAHGIDGTGGYDNIEAIADGLFCPKVPCLVRCEVRADGKYPAVMAASIIAKEWRDRIMTEMDALYPQYGYAKHKGYPTKAHVQVLHEIGPSPIQRKTFKYH